MQKRNTHWDYLTFKFRQTAGALLQQPSLCVADLFLKVELHQNVEHSWYCFISNLDANKYEFTFTFLEINCLLHLIVILQLQDFPVIFFLLGVVSKSASYVIIFSSKWKQCFTDVHTEHLLYLVITSYCYFQ